MQLQIVAIERPDELSFSSLASMENPAHQPLPTHSVPIEDFGCTNSTRAKNLKTQILHQFGLGAAALKPLKD